MTKICNRVFPNCTSISVNKQNFKLLHRIYFTPVRLQKMFPNSLNLCYKCKIHKGIFFHVFWSCVTFRYFGKGFILGFKILVVNSTLSFSFPAKPYTWQLFWNIYQISVHNSLNSCKKSILLRWSAPQVPMVDVDFTDVDSSPAVETDLWSKL